jgi:uncharacterized protein YdeI (YjbR/CyaY-like superfamily)
VGTRDKRVDAYIAKSADFAKPILTYLREVVHEACPDVEETMKWSAPHFMYNGMLCVMASFKEHCGFGFWKGALVVETDGKADQSAGQFGRITRISDLPPKKVLVGYIKKAMALNESGTAVPRKPKRAARDVTPPDYFVAALKKNKKARATFEGFSPSRRREYVEWITEAKREATRQQRLEQALEWLAEGKPRHWKYTKA